VAHLVVKAAQHLLAAVQLRHLGTQAVEDGRELAGDVAPTHHQQPLREGLQVEHLVGGDDVLAALEMGHMRCTAGGDQDVLGGQGLVARRAVSVQCGQAHGVGVLQLGKAVEHGHARAAQQVGVHAVEAGNLLGAVGLERAPVEGGRSAFPAVAVRFLERLRVVGRVAVELFGDAAHVHAGAAQAIGAQGLGQRHAHAALGRHAGGAHAAAAAANHEKVKVKMAHGVVVS